jgi:hypothetical protein
METSQRHVAEIVYTGAARAYGFQAVADEGFDEELCARCQWVRPDDGHRFCPTCEQEATT